MSNDMKSPWAARLLPLTAETAGLAAELEAVCFPCGWTREQYEKACASGSCWGVVCPAEEEGEAPCGYLAVSSVLDEMEILNVAVRPDLRGRGLATAMLAETLREAAERRIVSCLLEVREGNTPALALYSRAGFAPCGLRKHYYSDNGENAVVMALELAGRS